MILRQTRVKTRRTSDKTHTSQRTQAIYSPVNRQGSKGKINPKTLEKLWKLTGKHRNQVHNGR